MPSIMTLEGPRGVGCVGCARPSLSSASAVKAIGAVGVGGALLLGVGMLVGAAWLLKRATKPRLSGPDMLKIIAAESKTAEEFARRAEAWNASEHRPMPVSKLARAYRKAKPSTVARLIREAREAREEARERLWTRMSRGLRGFAGYKLAYLDRGKRDVAPFVWGDLETAAREMRKWKRRGFTVWIEDEDGNHVPVKGAMKRPGV